MRMIVVALVGGALIGFVDAQLLSGSIQQWVTSPSYQMLAIAGVAAFLGTIWGWVAKGMVGSRAKD
jgi:hypothetical protein